MTPSSADRQQLRMLPKKTINVVKEALGDVALAKVVKQLLISPQNEGWDA